MILLLFSPGDHRELKEGLVPQPHQAPKRVFTGKHAIRV